MPDKLNGPYCAVGGVEVTMVVGSKTNINNPFPRSTPNLEHLTNFSGFALFSAQINLVFNRILIITDEMNFS